MLFKRLELAREWVSETKSPAGLCMNRMRKVMKFLVRSSIRSHTVGQRDLHSLVAPGSNIQAVIWGSIPRGYPDLTVFQVPGKISGTIPVDKEDNPCIKFFQLS